MDALGEPQIRSALTGNFGGFIRCFDEIGSTNTEAAEWATCGAPEGAVVVADHQTGGRGRWGRSWFSAPGKLLQFSLILRPDLDPSKHGLLTAGLGVATAQALRSLSGLAIEVKWPNDAVIEGRKLAGMLVESTMMRGKIDAAVCGIGINVHLEIEDIPDELKDRATSLAIEMGTAAPARAEILGRILAEVEARYPAMVGDPAPLLDEARSLSAVLGKDVVVRSSDGTSIEGRATDFDEDGALLVDVDGATTPIHVGEIEQLRTQ